MTIRGQRRAELERICRAFGVTSLYAFGSRAVEIRDWLDGKLDRLVPGPSDVDVGVKVVPGWHGSAKDNVHFVLELENLFGCSRVDLVVLNAADSFLAGEVVRGERIYAQDEYDADEYDLYVLRRAGDQAPLEREWLAHILEVEA